MTTEHKAVADESAPDTEAPKATNVLFFIQDPRIIEMATLQLEKAGYKIAFARTTIEAFAQIQNFKPDVILISWNLKKLNVKSLYNHFSEKLGALVVVFSELNDPMTTMKLNNSGIQNSLFPPISGQGIQTRIQILLKKHKEQGAHLNKSNDVGFKTVKKESLPLDTEWNKVHVESKDTDKTALWKGVSTSTKDKLYFFESEHAPNQIFVDAHEEKKENDAIVFMETDHAGEKLLSAIQNLKPTKEMSAVSGHVENNLSPSLSLLEKMLKKAVSVVLPSPQKPTTIIDVVNAVIVIPLSTSRFKGYVVAAQAKNKIDPKTVQDVYLELKKLLTENGETITEEAPIFESKINTISFQAWVKKKAGFFLSGNKDSTEVAFAFVERHHYPQIVEIKDETFYGTKIEGLLVENSTLTFDLYLHMPKNQKYLLYVKKKKLITEKIIQKLGKYKVDNVYFQKDEKEGFAEYSAITYLDFKA